VALAFKKNKAKLISILICKIPATITQTDRAEEGRQQDYRKRLNKISKIKITKMEEVDC
jgi:hypothetical protein